jgi:DNA-binding response OmpR family regulator
MKRPARIETVTIPNATILSVSKDDADSATLHRIFPDPCWITRTTLPSAFSLLREIPVSIVLCDCDLMPGTWREMLEHVSAFPDPPLIIVTSRLADERLWAEALNLGAYDVLVKPFDRTEVVRILTLACQHWQDRHGVYSSRTKQRKAATGA